ncbi:alpha/beta fold hydrolase [Miniphocaeibacter halophilus]|uniref:Alpha/beta fold hydrolase n=1 Tax=Miniphocaeibacter halophilus TaxID=2931922 RepID=A0AC61MPV4_9FIRM|nr:alpha/beta hydrolase [Miniphocaeibacter halophilus]QQK07597.1 alpha/beta fold hydrolase [Miniphocaeibacter halophilus]
MTRPEIGKSVITGKYKTNYLESGKGYPLIFIHGSGPGVSAYANWRLVLPKVAEKAHCYAMDMLGFGYSDKPTDVKYGMKIWTQQIVDFMDALNIEKADFVGNSFGGSLALSMALKYPERVRKLIMMGPMGVEFDISYGLNEVWGYKPSKENMLKLIQLFCYNQEYATEELAEVRFKASTEPGFQEAFSSMFPEPRQNSVDDMSFTDEEIKTVKNQTMIVHGREDKVIPVDNAFRLIKLIENAELHVFGHCGHWTQIERADDFSELVKYFISK